MYIPDFNYHKPQSILDACDLLEKSENGAALAGGTDLLVEMKQRLRQHDDLISLNDITELKSISEEADKIYIGACVTHKMLTNSAVINKYSKGIAEAAAKIGSEQIRNTGTIGGNLCTGASCADIAPILIALNASLEIANSKTVKTMPVREFFQHHKVIRLEKGEILTRIIVSKTEKGTGVCFEKFGLRDAASISVASACAFLTVNNNVVTNACIVLGAVAPTPRMSEGVSKIITGSEVSELNTKSNLLKAAGEAASTDAVPIDDIRGSAEYRKNIIKILTKRAILGAIEDAMRN